MTEYRTPSGRYILWPAIITAAQGAAGRWITVFQDAPASIVRDVRYRRPPALRRDDGRLLAQVRNAYPHPDTGTTFGDIYVRWTTDPEEATVPTSRNRRDVAITDELAAELDALAAAAEDTAVGARSRAALDILREYAEGTPRKTVVEEYRPVRVKVFASDELWQAVLRRADAEGVSVPAVLAEFATARLDRVRTEMRDGAGLA